MARNSESVWRPLASRNCAHACGREKPLPGRAAEADSRSAAVGDLVADGQLAFKPNGTESILRLYRFSSAMTSSEVAVLDRICRTENWNCWKLDGSA